MMLQPSKKEQELFDRLKKASSIEEKKAIDQELQKVFVEEKEALKKCPFIY